ncbi:MAG: hypothetical protein KGL90_05370 [Burkholderiales bacterium]|nr:hypothetical protein [Burkholderiales bacterium]
MRRPPQGFSLIDVLVVITLMALVAGGVLTYTTKMATQSAELLRTRQMMTLAQALLTEVRMMPFTINDAKNAGLTGGAEAMGPESNPGLESRYHVPGTPLATLYDRQYDNPNDYNGLAQPGPGCPGGICDLQGNLLNPPGSLLNGCSSAVAVAQQAMAGIPAAGALLITVTVSCPGLSPFVLQGLRTRHAPTIY